MPRPERRRLQFGLEKLLPWAAAVAVVCIAVVAIIPAFQEAQSHPMHPLQRELKNICLAMLHYHQQYGSFPYSDDGPRHALYLLRPFLDGEQLKWNHERERFEDGTFEYLNERDAQPGTRRVLIMARVGSTNQVLFGMADGVTLYYDCPGAPDRSLLGSWRTVEHFLVSDVTMLMDWCQTHPSSGLRRSETSVTDENGTLLVETEEIGVLSIRCEYSDGRLEKCLITTPKGIIEEDVETDHLGRVIGLSRKPDDWRTLLP